MLGLHIKGSYNLAGPHGLRLGPATLSQGRELGVPKDRRMSQRTDELDDAPLFRYRVREIAEAKGINLTQLARRADVTRETAERYWNNKVTRPTQALIKLARALECKVEDLIAIVNPDQLRSDQSQESASGTTV